MSYLQLSEISDTGNVFFSKVISFLNRCFQSTNFESKITLDSMSQRRVYLRLWDSSDFYDIPEIPLNPQNSVLSAQVSINLSGVQSGVSPYGVKLYDYPFEVQLVWLLKSSYTPTSVTGRITYNDQLSDDSTLVLNLWMFTYDGSVWDRFVYYDNILDSSSYHEESLPLSSDYISRREVDSAIVSMKSVNSGVIDKQSSMDGSYFIDRFDQYIHLNVTADISIVYWDDHYLVAMSKEFDTDHYNYTYSLFNTEHLQEVPLWLSRLDTSTYPRVGVLDSFASVNTSHDTSEYKDYSYPINIYDFIKHQFTGVTLALCDNTHLFSMNLVTTDASVDGEYTHVFIHDSNTYSEVAVLKNSILIYNVGYAYLVIYKQKTNPITTKYVLANKVGYDPTWRLMGLDISMSGSIIGSYTQSLFPDVVRGAMRRSGSSWDYIVFAAISSNSSIYRIEFNYNSGSPSTDMVWHTGYSNSNPVLMYYGQVENVSSDNVYERNFGMLSDDKGVYRYNTDISYSGSSVCVNRWIPSSRYIVENGVWYRVKI